MAILSRVKGIVNWLKNRGYHNDTALRIIKLYNFNKPKNEQIRKLIRYSNGQIKTDDVADKFFGWFGQFEKTNKIHFEVIKKNQGNNLKLNILFCDLSCCL